MNILQRIKNQFLTEIDFFFMAPALAWQLLFFVVPLLFIIVISFVKDWDISAWSGFTLNHYRAIFDIVYFHIIFRSTLLALSTAVIALICAYPVAYYIAFKARSLKHMFVFFLILPFWTNLLVQVYSWFFLLEKYGFINQVLLYVGIIKEPLIMLNTLFAVNVVMLYCYLPFMIMPIYTILEKVDYSLLEASYDLGATPTQTFLKVVIPLSFPGIVTGFFLVFVPAFAEFVIPLLLGGDKYMFVGGLISHYFLTARNSSMGAVFTIVSCIFLIIFAAVVQYVFTKKAIRVKERVEDVF